MGMAASDSEFHVLAVDDSVIDRKLIERLLKTSSYHVTTVDSGSKALEFLGLREDEEQSNSNQPSVSPNSSNQEVEVNLVITDYCMPGMTGYDLLKKIKESSSLRNIPVVIMSSENVPSRINRCLEEGAEEFFLKPVRLSDVNKLRPHMMKTKCKNQQNCEKLERLEQEESSLEQVKQEKQQDEESSNVSGIEVHVDIRLHPQQEHIVLQVDTQLQQQQQQQQLEIQVETQLQQQQQTQTQSNNSKRKAMEEGLSPDRTRPRYSGLTVV